MERVSSTHLNEQLFLRLTVKYGIIKTRYHFKSFGENFTVKKLKKCGQYHPTKINSKGA
jgi:hypothetical protein